jgi:flagellar assembly factor FliW
MPVLETPELGRVEFAEQETYHFAEGLPAFEHLRRFVLAQQSHLLPLAFLVSAEEPGLRFICVPVEAIAPDYELTLQDSDRETLAWTEAPPPHLVLAVLSFPAEGPPTANLLAPVVLNLSNGRGMQVVQAGSPYPVCHPLPGGAQK